MLQDSGGGGGWVVLDKPVDFDPFDELVRAVDREKWVVGDEPVDFDPFAAAGPDGPAAEQPRAAGLPPGLSMAASHAPGRERPDAWTRAAAGSVDQNREPDAWTRAAARSVDQDREPDAWTRAAAGPAAVDLPGSVFHGQPRAAAYPPARQGVREAADRLGAEVAARAALPDARLEGESLLRPAGDYGPRQTDLPGGVAVFGRGMLKLPQQVLAKALSMVRAGEQGRESRDVWDFDPPGGPGSLLKSRGARGKTLADLVIDATDEDMRAFIKEHGKENVYLPGIGISLRDLAELPEGLAFSIVSAGSGLAAGALTAAAGGGAAAVPTGAAAAGGAAYRMAKDSIVSEYRRIKEEQKAAGAGFDGQKAEPLTEEEWRQAREDFEAKAVENGLWEMLPEMFGSGVAFKILTAPFKKALARVVGKDVAVQLMVRLGGVYAEQLAEEGITQMGQHNVQASFDPRLHPRSFLSPEDWMESFREVAPGVFLLTTVMGPATYAGHKLYERAAGRKGRVGALKQAVAEGRLDLIPDDAFDTVLNQARALAKELPRDADVQAGLAELEGEAARRKMRFEPKGEPPDDAGQGPAAAPQGPGPVGPAGPGGAGPDPARAGSQAPGPAEAAKSRGRKAERQPWQMTREEFEQSGLVSIYPYETIVQRAHVRGEAVPAEVLAQFEDADWLGQAKPAGQSHPEQPAAQEAAPAPAGPPAAGPEAPAGGAATGYDFANTFPRPLDLDPDARVRIFGEAEAPDPDQVREQHEELMNDLLANRLDLAAVRAAEAQGVDPRTGKAPKTDKQKAALAEFLRREPEMLERDYWNALEAYGQGYGEEAAKALDAHVRSAAEEMERGGDGLPEPTAPAVAKGERTEGQDSAGREGDTLGAGLHRALHSTSGAEQRWTARRAGGLTNAELRDAIKDEFGEFGAMSGPGMESIAFQGGASPVFVYGAGHPASDTAKARLTGKELVAKAREVLDIPYPAAQPEVPATGGQEREKDAMGYPKPLKAGKESTYYLAMKAGKPGEKATFKPVQGRAVTIPGLEGVEFFLHGNKAEGWSVSEARSGARLVEGDPTQKSALITLEVSLEGREAEFADRIKRHVEQFGLSPRYAQGGEAQTAEPARPAKSDGKEAQAPAEEKQSWEMTREEFGKAHKPTRIFQQFTSEERANRAASHRMGHRQKEAVGEYFYTTPGVPGRAFDTAGQAKDAAHRASVERAVSEGKPVPRAVLEEYRGQEWADKPLAGPETPGLAATAPENSLPEPTPAQNEAGKYKKVNSVNSATPEMVAMLEKAGVSEAEKADLLAPDFFAREDGAPMKTGEPAEVDGFHGKGRKNKGSIYAEGVTGPVLGPGFYLAPSPTYAKIYGPQVEKATVRLENPFVLDKASDVPEVRNYYDNDSRQKILAAFTARVRKAGHDGVIVNIPSGRDVDAEGQSIKRLREVFGHAQVVKFPSSELGQREAKSDGKEAPGRGIRRYKDGDVVGTIGEATAGEIASLGLRAAPGDVTVAQRTIDYIDKSHGGQLTEQDVDALERTIAEPDEVLPNLAVPGKEYRENSVLLVRGNGKNYLTVVEMTPGEGGVLWNFWKLDDKKAKSYLRKFREEKARRLQPGGTAGSPHIPRSDEAGRANRRAEFSGSQAETPSDSNIVTPEEKGKGSPGAGAEGLLAGFARSTPAPGTGEREALDRQREAGEKRAEALRSEVKEKLSARDKRRRNSRAWKEFNEDIQNARREAAALERGENPRQRSLMLLEDVAADAGAPHMNRLGALWNILKDDPGKKSEAEAVRSAVERASQEAVQGRGLGEEDASLAVQNVAAAMLHRPHLDTFSGAVAMEVDRFRTLAMQKKGEADIRGLEILRTHGALGRSLHDYINRIRAAGTEEEVRGIVAEAREEAGGREKDTRELRAEQERRAREDAEREAEVRKGLRRHEAIRFAVERSASAMGWRARDIDLEFSAGKARQGEGVRWESRKVKAMVSGPWAVAKPDNAASACLYLPGASNRMVVLDVGTLGNGKVAAYTLEKIGGEYGVDWASLDGEAGFREAVKAIPGFSDLYRRLADGVVVLRSRPDKAGEWSPGEEGWKPTPRERGFLDEKAVLDYEAAKRFVPFDPKSIRRPSADELFGRNASDWMPAQDKPESEGGSGRIYVNGHTAIVPPFRVKITPEELETRIARGENRNMVLDKARAPDATGFTGKARSHRPSDILAPIAVERGQEEGEVDKIILSAKGFEGVVSVPFGPDIRYFLGNHPDLEMRFDPKNLEGPISLWSEGRLAGVIMPLREGAEAAEGEEAGTRRTPEAVRKWLETGFEPGFEPPDLAELKAEAAPAPGAGRESGHRPSAPPSRQVIPRVASGPYLTDPVRRSAIMRMLDKALDVPIRIGGIRNVKAGGRKAAGIYKPGPGVARLRKANDVEVAAHEIAHHIQSKKLMPLPRVMPAEVKALAYEGADSKNKEGFAEFVRLYVTQPEEALARAPEFHAFFEAELANHPDLEDAVSQARAMWEQWVAQPDVAKVLSFIRRGETQGRRWTLNGLYRAVIDEFRPFQALKAQAEKSAGRKLEADEDPYLAAWLTRGWVGKAEHYLKRGAFQMDKEGGYRTTGPSLRDILRPIHRAGLMDILDAYLVARRAAHDERIRKGFEGIMPGRIWGDAAQEIEAAHPEVREAADKLHAYCDELLTYLVNSGRIAPEAAAAMRQGNLFYAPLYRVMESEAGATAQAMSGKRFGGLFNPVKRLKGSSRDIHSPVENILKNTYALINVAERNRVGEALLKAAEIPGMGRFLEVKPVNLQVDKVDVAGALGQLARWIKGAEGKFGGYEDLLGELLGDVRAVDKLRGELAGLDDAAAAAKMREAGFAPEDLEALGRFFLAFRPDARRAGPSEAVFYRRGKPVLVEMDPDLAAAVKGLNAEAVSGVVKVLALPAGWLRAGAVLSPEFMIRNPARDTFEAALNSDKGFVPFYHTLKGLFHVLKQDELYRKFYASGAAHGALVSLDRNYLSKDVERLTASRLGQVGRLARNPLELLRSISETMEEATRVGEFELQIGDRTDMASMMRAGQKARDITLDFGRRGSRTLAMNLISAFWNASVQGTDKMARAIAENPTRYLTRAFLGITLPSLLLWGAQKDDPEYQDLPGWRRILFWNFVFHMSGGKTFVFSLPKPFTPGILFGSFPEMMAEWMDKEDPEGMRDAGRALLESLAPGIMPTLLLFPTEWWAEKNFFFDRPTVPRGTEGLDPVLQFDERTSEGMKLLGRGMHRVPGLRDFASPAKLQNAYRGLTGGLGRLVLEGVDKGLTSTGLVDAPAAPAGDWTDLPGLRGVADRFPLESSRGVELFYRRLGEARQEFESARQRAGLRGKGYDRNPPADLWLMEQAAKDLSFLRGMARETHMNPKATPERKREVLDNIYERMAATARGCLDALRAKEARDRAGRKSDGRKP